VNAKIYVHEAELRHIHDPHPLDYRYLEDYILDVEEAGQLVVLDGDAEIVPGVRVMHTPAHTEGGMTVLVDTHKGVAAITGFCVIMDNLAPPKEITAREMEVIPCGTVVNAYQAYDNILKVKQAADILLPLHEPRFAATPTIPE
jgi:glyoxylase-like metal-dependent hydrolase (beta-lactamase superfamily II)